VNVQKPWLLSTGVYVIGPLCSFLSM